MLAGLAHPWSVVGDLLPTLIHVSLFTLVFMALGAFRSGARFQWLLIGSMLRRWC